MKSCLLLPVLFSTLLSCNYSNKIQPQVQVIAAPPHVVANDNAESFDSFNAKFHSDSVFQMSRIAFPIGGQQADDAENQKWTPANWQFLATPVSAMVDTTQYKHSLEMTDSYVTEKFWIDK